MDNKKKHGLGSAMIILDHLKKAKKIHGDSAIELMEEDGSLSGVVILKNIEAIPELSDKNIEFVVKYPDGSMSFGVENPDDCVIIDSTRAATIKMEKYV